MIQVEPLLQFMQCISRRAAYVGNGISVYWRLYFDIRPCPNNGVTEYSKNLISVNSSQVIMSSKKAEAPAPQEPLEVSNTRRELGDTDVLLPDYNDRTILGALWVMHRTDGH